MNKNEFHVGSEGQQPVPLAAGALADRHKIGVAAFEMITAAGLMASPGECLPGDSREGVRYVGGGEGGYCITQTNPASVYVWGSAAGGCTDRALLGRIVAQHHDAA